MPIICFSKAFNQRTMDYACIMPIQEITASNISANNYVYMDPNMSYSHKYSVNNSTLNRT